MKWFMNSDCWSLIIFSMRSVYFVLLVLQCGHVMKVVPLHRLHVHEEWLHALTTLYICILHMRVFFVLCLAVVTVLLRWSKIIKSATKETWNHPSFPLFWIYFSITNQHLYGTWNCHDINRFTTEKLWFPCKFTSRIAWILNAIWFDTYAVFKSAF